jgi:hypothetical protein
MVPRARGTDISRLEFSLEGDLEEIWKKTLLGIE